MHIIKQSKQTNNQQTMPRSKTAKVMADFEHARSQFVQEIQDLSSRSQHTQELLEAGVVTVLRPLLVDPVPRVKHGALVALSQLANYSDDFSQFVVRAQMLSEIISSMYINDKDSQKASANVLCSLAKHSPELARAVVDAGGTKQLMVCLKSIDPEVKESGAWALGHIAMHNEELAQSVVDEKAVSLLVLCLQDKSRTVRTMAASALKDISKHSALLAQCVADADAILLLAHNVRSSDVKLKNQSLAALSQVAKHKVELAEKVVESKVFPAALQSLKHLDQGVKKNAACLIRDVVKHHYELAHLVVSRETILRDLADFIKDNKGGIRIPAILAIGFIVGHAAHLAMAALHLECVPVLIAVVKTEGENETLKAATIWALGELSKHTPKHAEPVINEKVLPIIQQLHDSAGCSEDTKAKCKDALSKVINVCTNLAALEPLILTTDPEILQWTLKQYSVMLPDEDSSSRSQFIKCGALKKVQELKVEANAELRAVIEEINVCFPEEAVKYYSPGYSDTILKKVEEYQPKIKKDEG